MVRVQHEDFDLQEVYSRLRSASPGKTGAVVVFTGLVREFGDHTGVQALELEHYPGMTEKSLQKIIDTASSRWELLACEVIHRIGRLEQAEQIVLVAVSSPHRGEAFAACEFIMDYLKTDAPFWKKEIMKEGSQWVEAKESDEQRRQNWS